MKTLKYILLAFLFIPFVSHAQTKEITFQNKLYEYSEGNYYIKSNNTKYKLVKDNVVVKLKNNLKLKDIQFSNFGLPELKQLSAASDGEYLLLKIPKENDLLDILTKLKNTNLFEDLEPNVYAKYLSVPDDDYYASNSHWNLDKLEMEKRGILHAVQAK